MGGRLIDYIGQGAAADRPVPADMPALISVGASSIYYANDTGVMSLFNADTVAWDTIDLAALGAPYTDAMADARIAAASIDDLDDVDTSTTPPADGDGFFFDAGSGLWKPKAASAGATEALVNTSGWYVPADSMIFSNTSTTAGAPTNLINFFPFSRKCSIDAVATEITIAGAAGSQIRGGLYSSNPVTGLPDTLIEEGAFQAIDSIGIKAITFAAARAITDPVWLAVCASAAATYRQGTTAQRASRIFGAAAIASTNTLGKLSAAYAFAALPANTSALSMSAIASNITVAARLA